MTPDDLRKRLRYDPDTGEFRWIAAPRRGVAAGSVAGTLDRHGHRHICHVSAHRLAWLFLHGELPAKNVEIDHINGKRDDNRAANLRLCSHAENLRNQTRSGAGGSAFKGVVLFPKRRRWAARITVNYKAINLGYFATPELAARAYDAAAREHFGRFAKLNFPTEG